ncbi:hypothetical protein BC941DRAFT_468041 [Chlamydoabsidia padenii]|nr:hypothetical protein BC941DRAFT_468041 [Chlamydoabsidia padenii]
MGLLLSFIATLNNSLPFDLYFGAWINRKSRHISFDAHMFFANHAALLVLGLVRQMLWPICAFYCFNQVCFCHVIATLNNSLPFDLYFGAWINRKSRHIGFDAHMFFANHAALLVLGLVRQMLWPICAFYVMWIPQRIWLANILILDLLVPG